MANAFLPPFCLFWDKIYLIWKAEQQKEVGREGKRIRERENKRVALVFMFTLKMTATSRAGSGLSFESKIPSGPTTCMVEAQALGSSPTVLWPSRMH